MLSWHSEKQKDKPTLMKHPSVYYHNIVIKLLNRNDLQPKKYKPAIKKTLKTSKIYM